MTQSISLSHPVVASDRLPCKRLPSTRRNAKSGIDVHHRYWAAGRPGPLLRHLDVGAFLKADDGFACLSSGQIVPVRASRRFGSGAQTRDLFVPCNCGRHYLEPDAEGRVDGFTIAHDIRGGVAA